jgi:hypothetical protein
LHNAGYLTTKEKSAASLRRSVSFRELVRKWGAPYARAWA